MNLGERLAQPGIVIVDGGMGTELEAAGLNPGGHNNLNNPAAVADVHRRYVESGATLIITNTLTLNRIYVETHGLDLHVREANLAGARLAREAVGQQAFVLGDISATGQMLEPYGDYTEEQFVAAFTEQTEALTEGGVDGFILETLYDLREARCALRACRAATKLPILVSITFQTADRGGRTMMGNTAADCATALAADGADVVGTNCGEVDPLQMAQIVAAMRPATNLPLIAMPNAGKPRLAGDKAVFDMPPEEFARGVLACRDAGARVLGGCCGTTPAHIRAMAAALNGN